jgi:uncharacterized protein
MSVAQKASAKKNGGVRAAVPPKNLQIVKKAYEAFGRRDIPAVLEVLDPKIEWLEPAGSLPPPAGSGMHRGREAVEKEVFGTIPKTWDSFRVEPESFFEAGDHVVVAGRFHVRPSAGRAEVEAPCVQIWRLHGGKAVRMQNYTDTYQLAQALGR